MCMRCPGNLLNDAMQVGSGARVGEQVEHLWALTKAFSKLARYMSRARWVEGLNLLLQELTRTRQATFVYLVSQRIKRTASRLGKP